MTDAAASALYSTRMSFLTIVSVLLCDLVANHRVYYPTPANLNYFWIFGLLTGIIFAFQLISGIFLAFVELHYTCFINY